MGAFFLDAGGAGIVLLIPVAIIFLVFLWGVIEGFIINLFGINGFWESVWHAIVVNLVSLMAGFVLLGIAHGLHLDEYTQIRVRMKQVPSWILFFTVSVVVEALVLKSLSKTKTWSRILSTSLVMNTLTFIVLFSYAYYYL